MQPPPHLSHPPELPMCVCVCVCDMRTDSLMSTPRLTRRGDGSLSGSWIGCGIALTCYRTLVCCYEGRILMLLCNMSTDQGKRWKASREALAPRGSKRTGFRRG